MAGEEHAELVLARHHVVDHDALALLLDKPAATELVDGEHGGVARMVRVVGGGTVRGRAVFALHREVVGDRDGFVVRDEEPVVGPRGRGPRADLGLDARAHQIDGGAAAELVRAALRRKASLVGAPPELGRLDALGRKAVDRPGVDELAGLLGHGGRLRVALGNVDRFDAEARGKGGPLLARRRRRDIELEIGRNVEQRHLDKVRDEPGVGPVRDHGGRAARTQLADRKRSLALRVVRALRDREPRVRVPASPRLHNSVDVEQLALAAVLEERSRRHVHGDIDQKIAGRGHRVQDLAIVCRLEGLDEEPHTEEISLRTAAVVGSHDGDAVGGESADVLEEQGKKPLPNGAKTHKDKASRELDEGVAIRASHH
eukprot:Amastigsp_a509405_127.p2 type:complete len:372 gc:universal Amastigsp_a509405_127:375-1490(+)